MGRETLLKYGEITLASQGESLDTLREKLDSLLNKHGYPSKSIDSSDSNDLPDLDDGDDDDDGEDDSEDKEGESAEEDLPYR